MWTVLNYQTDITDSVNTDGFQVQSSISDPIAKMDFSIDDSGSNLSLQEVMDIVVYDENLVLPDGSSGNPTHNFLTNVMLQNTDNLPTTVATGWSAGGSLSNKFTWSNNQFNVTFSVSNAAIGSGLASQQTQVGYIIPGVQYCFSLYVQGSGTISNLQAVLQVNWEDAGGNALSTISQNFTPNLTNQRFSITGTAPANAAYAVVIFGGQTISTTNSGSMVLDEPQLEPMWFVNRGVSYPTALCNFSTTTSVQMPDGTSSRACRVFSGYIDDLQSEYEGNNRIWTVSCAGPGAVLENTGLININYSTPTLDSTIIKSIIDTYYSGILSYGPPHFQTISTTVQDGITVQSFSASDQSFREVMNGMSDASGYVYFVDNYFFVRYQPVYWDTTNISISDNPDYVTSYPPQDYKLEKDATQIKNRIKVVGGKFIAPAITDTFSGNGSTRVFNLSQQPYNVQSVTVGGTAQKTGVTGVNTLGSGGYVAVVDKGAGTLTFNSAPASGTNNVVITYTYEAPVVVSVQSLDSYSLYGKWFDSKVNDSSLTSTNAARVRGLAELTKLAFSQVVLTLNLNQLISPGTTVLFTSQHDGYSQQPFTVQQMNTVALGGGVYEYQYTCGYYRPTFEDLLRNTHKAVNRSQTTANVNAIIQTNLVTSDTIRYTDSVAVNVLASGSFVYGTAVYGYSTFA